jgi:very-short-patch-repair endonuclease
MNPKEISCGTQQKAWWKCTKGHGWCCRISTRTYIGSECPLCRTRSEQRLYNLLKKRFPDFTIEYQKKFDWCISTETERKYPFDFYIVELDLLIELDGEQHFKQIMNWKSKEENQQRDVFKMTKALENNKKIIRITRTMFSRKKNKLDDILFKHVNGEFTIMYICENNEYDIYIDLMKKEI